MSGNIILVHPCLKASSSVMALFFCKFRHCIVNLSEKTAFTVLSMTSDDSFKVCNTTGTLEIQFVKYSRPTDFGCEGLTIECNPKFKICFKHLKPSGWNINGCKTSKLFRNTMELTFGMDINGIHNPVKLPLTSSLPLGAAVTVKVTQDPTFGLGGSGITLGQYTLTLRGKGSQTGSLYTLTDESHEHSTLTVKMKLVCSQDYYGRHCHVHCPAPRPADHYTCNKTTGHKQCKTGTCSVQGTKYSCLCPTGYSGTRCETTPCTNNHNCKNGGTCVSKGPVYTCHCPTGYSGSTCQTTQTPCSSNPCFNKGTCSYRGTSYSCQCHSGYIGTRCETELCSYNNCKNGGTCIDRGSSYTCQCPAGYSGAGCELTPCSYSNCNNGRVCVIKDSSYTCQCPVGYTGAKCETPCTNCETPCSHNNCRNGGTCRVRGSSYVCQCPLGSTGMFCEVTACSHRPCQNNGACYTFRGIYICNCAPGYSGVHCEITPCTSNPCQNSGTCITDGTSYTCSCRSEYTGEHCQLSVEECRGSTCFNRGNRRQETVLRSLLSTSSAGNPDTTRKTTKYQEP
ncbi:neurogenic locus protein delta-like [Gigantopelta aegis]|uniref:neurogenic locus protein delta-like n=1 Tax=Gigantopelta aegis TaxID=1735272 RepID=UPI001B88D77C|nr:neurogenic locus protein delta-like [Gigantopelta aegis]